MLNRILCWTIASFFLAALVQQAAAIHLSFTNTSAFPSDQVYVWFGGAAEAGYDLKIAGQARNVTLGQSYPLDQLAAGLNLNRLISGRVYFSFGEPLPDPGRTAGGSPVRYPGVSPGDDGYNTRWDFIELTESGAAGDIADLTSMDNFGIPLQLQLKRAGAKLTGPNTSATWRGHTDAQVVAALALLASPAASNIYHHDGKFIRVKGANSFPPLYQNEASNPRSMTAYLNSIKAAGRVTVFDGHAFGVDYQYSAAIDGAGNYVLTKTGGAAGNPNTILVPASYKAGPNPADPTLTLGESLYNSNPWYGVDGGPIGPTQNNLAGAIARDLYAALNLGYVNSDHIVNSTDTVDPALVGKHVYELTGSQMRELTIGFEQVNQFHNIYASAVRQVSDSYGFAYTDWNEHLTKVAVLFNQAHGGVVADELNVEIMGNVLTGLTGSGDYNHDNVVDAADYTVWREMLGRTGPNLAADGTFDGTVDEHDFDQWKATFGASLGLGGGSGSMATTVPEPAAIAAAVTSVAAGIVLGRRRN
ncbi:MAG: beta-1,3-glucanase family protein [Pirellulales bacterium]